MKIFQKLFLLLLLVTLAYRLYYIWAGGLNLAQDEAHYWDWSRHLDLSYYSKGPMVAYIIFFFTWLGGHSEFFVRLGAVIISLGTAIFVYLLARDMFKNELVGFFSAFILFLIPLFSVGSIFMTTDSPFIFFWSLAIYFIYKSVSRNIGWWWYLAGIALGLGLLSKYTMIILVPQIFLFLLLSRKSRHWLTRKEPYLAFIIGLIVFSPVIIWNGQHNWVSLRHLFGQGNIGVGPLFSVKDLPEFLASQIGVISPLIFFALVYALWRSAKYGIGKGDDNYLLLFCCSFPLLAFYLLLSLHTKVQGNWAAAAYITLSVAGVAIFADLYPKMGSIYKRRALRVFIFAALLLGFALSCVGYNVQLVRLVGVDLPVLSVRLMGWKELGIEVSKIMDEMSAKNHTFIFSKSYHISSELAFYTNRPYQTYCVNTGRRQNQFDYWEGFHHFIGSDAIYVVEGKDSGVHSRVRRAFNSFQKEPPLLIRHQDRVIKAFSIFRLYGFKGLSPVVENISY